MRTFLISLSLSLAAAFFAFNAGVYYGERGEDESVSYEATDAPVPQIEELRKDEPALSEIIEREIKNVVAISTENEYASGVIVSKKGYIATNKLTSDTVTVTLSDGSVTGAKTVWSDKTYDVSILKADREFDTRAEIGEAESLKTGDDVIAIEAPRSMRFERSAARGIVSAVGISAASETEEGKVYVENLIQTDARTDSESMGCPLLNASGEVIGISATRINESEGAGFAVPLCFCEGVIRSLEENGSFREAKTGFRVCNAATARYLMQKDTANGLFVTELDRLGKAYEAGMRCGDVITEFNGERMDSTLELRRKILLSDKNAEMSFIVKKGDKEMEISFFPENSDEESAS